MQERKTAAFAVLLIAFSLLACGCSGESKRGKAVLNEQEKAAVREQLAEMKNAVEVISYVREDCPPCEEVMSLFDEVAGIQEKVIHKSYRLDKDNSPAGTSNISLVPATVIQKDKDIGLRFYGVPHEGEFFMLIEAIQRLSTGSPIVSATGLAALLDLRVPINIKIFVSPA